MSELSHTNAALYLLGQLDAPEAAAFSERLAAGDARYNKALADANELVAAVALSVKPVAPPPDLKARLMSRLDPPPPNNPYPGLFSKRAHEQGPWKPSKSAPGVFYKKLYHDKEAGLVTTLVKMEPGARLAAHTHSKTEQCLILEGDLRYNDQKIYRAGDFTWALSGSVDPALYTVEGNLLLIISGVD